MTTWSYEQELAFRETQKALRNSQEAYRDMDERRDIQLARISDCLCGLSLERMGTLEVGQWCADRATALVKELLPFTTYGERIGKLEADLKLAAETLRYYESMHRAKLQGSLMSEEEEKRTRIKIDRNQSLAERFEATLGIKPEGASQ